MSKKPDHIEISYDPDIEGLKFRKYRDEEDLRKMLRVFNISNEADDIEDVKNLEDIKRDYSHLTNCNIFEDVLLVEVNGKVIGYSRVWWNQIQGGNREYRYILFLIPEWRGTGIMEAMIKYNQKRIKEIAKDHPDEIEKEFCVYCSEGQNELMKILEELDYEIVRYFFEMVRPNLEDIPGYELPDEIEIKDAKKKHYRNIWEAAREAFKDEWNEPEWQEEWYEEWLESPYFQPRLWKIAWEDDEVVGQVRSYIDKKENKKFERKRGYTENICVRKPWRGQGIAKALIAKSLMKLKEVEMKEAALGVDSENPSGALELYKKLGFKKRKTIKNYRKKFE
ncbi:MAG: GNAT family N-acetyltransferase [Thermoplasmatota archaeon]